MLTCQFGLAEGDERKPAFEHQLDAHVLRLGMVRIKSVGGGGLDDVAHRHHRILVEILRQHLEMIIGAAQALADPHDQAFGVVAHVVGLVEDKRDDEGLAGLEPHAGAVRQIADLLGDVAHALLGPHAEFGPVLKRARHRRHAEAGQFGDRLERRPRHWRDFGRHALRGFRLSFGHSRNVSDFA